MTDPHAERTQGLKRKFDEVTPSETKSAAIESPALSVDLTSFNSADELLAKLGGDKLKAELQRMGLKCGGTPMQRAERLFATKGKAVDELDPSMLATSSNGAKRRKI